ncbi:WD40 repeat domain-containing protein [Streptomyces sp. NPDC001292]|uniref:WD40 repeat domain-containing protein n=1 Tax=Streptomyces sp. NPDC001292 TaxID=3364558 RepID=UPI0036949A00
MSTTAESPLAWDISVHDAPVALSARGDLVAVAGAAGTVKVLDAAMGAEIGSFDLSGGALGVALSPDAGHVVATGPMGYALWRRSDGRTTVRESGAWSAAAAWADGMGVPPDERSRGGGRVAVAAGRRVLVLDAEGDELWRTEPAASTVTDLAWMRRGRRLAVAAYGAVRCHERHTEKPVATYPYVGSHLALAIAPTGKWICSGNQDASIHIWRARDGGGLTMSGYPEKVSRLAFDDTGFWLAADGAPDVTVWDFSGKGPEGTAPRSLRCHETVTALAWRPGAAGHLASGGADGTVALWYATAGRPQACLRPVRELDGTGAAVAALAWAGPHLLVVARRDGRIRTYGVPSRTAL